MNRDPAKEILKEPVELPQIRFPIKGTKTAAELAADQVDVEKLGKIVAEAFGAIAKATGLSESEVLHVIEDTHAEMLKDVLKDRINVEVLRESIQQAIKDISLATDLDTEQITDIFAAKKNTSLKDIVSRLHDRCQVNRAKFGN